MYRSFRPVVAVLPALVLAGTTAAAEPAPPGSRVAMTDSVQALEPGGLLVRAAELRTRAADAVDAVFDTDWIVDVAATFGARLHDAAGESRAWFLRIAVALAPTPPDLTCLVAFPIPDHTTSGYGWRDDPINHREQFHAGADIHAARGTPVHAAGDGQVIFAGRQHGYGNIIYVDHGNGVITRYAHLSKILVAKGDVVQAAQEIGKVGATGRVTGPHLHFEVRIDGLPVSPELAMQVAGLEREAPEMAKLVGLALAPDVQSHWINEQDPPRSSRAATPSKDKPKGSRPERRGRAPRQHLSS
jgi:murein DD-endopeptidase MepM/ murein hydrolase activator NlpD